MGTFSTMANSIPLVAKQKSGTAPTGAVPIDIWGISGGGGGGAVDSVNGQTGDVVLDAGDVGARPSGNVPWGEVSGKPATFPPTIGATGSTAVAGDDSRLGLASTAVQPAEIANFVPNSRKVAGKALTADVMLTPGDIGAATTAQGAKADTAVQPAALASKENTLTAGANITINRSNPNAPIISASGGGGGSADWGGIGGTLSDQADLQAALDAKASESWVDDQIQAIDFPVDSVNGKQGSVVLGSSDVGAAPIVSAPNRVYATDGSGAQSSRPITDFATAAQGAKADSALQNAAAFATAAQGAKADSAVQPAAIANFVPDARTINAKPLNANITLTSGDVGAATAAQGAKADSALQNAAAFATAAQGVKADTAVQPAGLTKAAVGLPNVDNTSDASKPVSTAQQTALNLKAPLASPAFTGTPTGITKAHVGLPNVDNTSDANKPVSTAQATAIAAKVSGLNGVTGLWAGTQAQYDAIGSKDPNVAYLVTD